MKSLSTLMKTANLVMAGEILFSPSGSEQPQSTKELSDSSYRQDGARMSQTPH
jgi:hypothetical protein